MSGTPHDGDVYPRIINPWPVDGDPEPWFWAQLTDPDPYPEDRVLLDRLIALAGSRGHRGGEGLGNDYVFGLGGSIVSRDAEHNRHWFLASPFSQANSEIKWMVQGCELVETHSSLTAEEVLALFTNYLDALPNRFANDDPRTPDAVVVEHELTPALEALATAWPDLADQLPLTPEDRIEGDAIAALFGELSKVEEPDRSLVRAGVDWFARKLNIFTDAAAQSAGEAVGKAVVYGTGAAVSSPFVVDAVVKIAQAVGHA